jgi:hypothetical protein
VLNAVIHRDRVESRRAHQAGDLTLRNRHTCRSCARNSILVGIETDRVPSEPSKVCDVFAGSCTDIQKLRLCMRAFEPCPPSLPSG